MANADNGSCIWYGCTDDLATNTALFSQDARDYNGVGIQDDGSCTYGLAGCTEPVATSYNSAATADNGSCTYPVTGFTESTASNYDNSAVTDDGSCAWSFCSESLDNSYGTVNGNVNFCTVHYPGSSTSTCITNLQSVIATYKNTTWPPAGWVNTGCTSGGCTDPNATGYLAIYTWDDGSCGGCTSLNAWNYGSAISVDDGSCVIDCDFGSCPTATSPPYAIDNIVGADPALGTFGSFTIKTETGACFTTTENDPTVYPYDFNLITPGNSIKTTNATTGKVTFTNMTHGTHLITLSVTLPHQTVAGNTTCNMQLSVDIHDIQVLNACNIPAANNYIDPSNVSPNIRSSTNTTFCKYPTECYR